MRNRQQYSKEPQQWLTQLAALREKNDTSPISSAMGLYAAKDHGLLEKGLGIADILLSLELDNNTLAAAIAYPGFQAQVFPLEKINELLGKDSSKLLKDVLQMQSLGKLQHLNCANSQIENLRKMLLAMVTDVRSVLIILAERLWQLHFAKTSSPEDQQRLAQEALDVYAPLANRLGILQLKWEIEDLSLRYLQPEAYSQVAKSLAARRVEREAYIQSFIAVLSDTLKQEGIKSFQVTGRVKHIYSIYRKMLRKEADFEKIYDISALRVLVTSVEDCYAVLGLLQSHWQQIPEEFDDYISQPKPNGYRSLHTVIVGPENKFVEVQIRTFQMHEESELGVASHWRYKEGLVRKTDYEAKIALLRQVMAWQKEVINNDETKTSPAPDLFADKVYVFTPAGDILDLENGSTPLDFAYHIHSDIGHRCRGAKVNGHIVPLTYQLQTGERIEILTAKNAGPSRDWINPNYGFLKTSRARAKAAHWFRVQDNAKSAASGRDANEQELKKNYVPPLTTNLDTATSDTLVDLDPHVQILGIKNLLTQVARCCKPLPGDSIIGYVTRNRGLSIHRRDCRNILHVTGPNRSRLMEVKWSDGKAHGHPADLLIRSYDRTGLLRDITTLLAEEKINVLRLHAQKSAQATEVDIYLTIEILSRQQLKKAMNVLKSITDVIELRRR